jgi:hypothetical protein
VKRAADLSLILSRDFTWLPRWQELILNWISSWSTIGTLVVTSAKNDEQAEWHVPTDTELARAELEEAFQR